MFALHTLALNNKNYPTNHHFQSEEGTKRTRYLISRIELYYQNCTQRTIKFNIHALKPNALQAAAVRDLAVFILEFRSHVH
jgi:hypothetical protein